MGSEEKIVTSGSEMQLVSLVVMISLVVVISLVVIIILVVIISLVVMIRLVVCDEIDEPDEPGKLGSSCLSELAVTCLRLLMIISNAEIFHVNFKVCLVRDITKAPSFVFW